VYTPVTGADWAEVIVLLAQNANRKRNRLEMLNAFK
jgi:hypothetical protein